MISAWRDYIPVIGLVGTLVTALATWARDLNSTAQRIRTLDEATKRAAFWDTWYKAMSAADPQLNASELASKVRTEIAAAAESVEKAFCVLAVQRASEAQQASQHQRAQHSVSRVRRWLLLYKPPRARAWIPRLFFYLYLVYTPFFPFIGPRKEPSEAAVGVLGGVLMIIIFRALAYWAEKPRAVAQAN